MRRRFYLQDDYGNEAEFTQHNAMRIAETHRIAGGVFNDSLLDPNYSTTLVANGTAAVTNGEAILSTTVDSGSSSILTTIGVARYISTNPNFFRANICLGDLGTLKNLRAWGCFDSASKNDGYWFQLNEKTFQIVTCRDGTQTVVSTGQFNGRRNFVPTTNYATYEIYYTAREVLFSVNGVLIHSISAGNSPIVSTRHMRPFVQNTNTGVGSVCTINSMNLTINRLGTLRTQPLNKHIAGETTGVLVKGGPGTLHHLTINSSSNTTVVSLYDNTDATDAAKAIALVDVNVSAPPVYLPYEWDFSTGLYVVVVGTASDISIGYE